MSAPRRGTGGHGRRRRAGRGPTPRAEDRPYHPAYRSGKGASQRRGRRRGERAGHQAGRGGGGTSGAEWVAGRNPVVEALRANVPVTQLLVAAGTDRDNRMREVFAQAAQRGVKLAEVARAELDQLTSGAVHQGVVAQVEPFAYAHPDELVALAHQRDETPLIVVLDSITDPHNLGAIIRSVAGFGAHGVVIPERRSAQMTIAAWKASAGAAARVPVARTVNITNTIKAYQKAGLMAVGLAADGEVELPQLPVATLPLVVAIGSEGEGLSRLVAETCDVLVSIPMSSALESLNASVAAAVTLYSITQQRLHPES